MEDGPVSEPSSGTNEGAEMARGNVSDVEDYPAGSDDTISDRAEIQELNTGVEGLPLYYYSSETEDRVARAIGSESDVGSDPTEPNVRGVYGPDVNVALRLAEGDHEGEWFKAIEGKDCFTLADMLEHMEVGTSFSKCLETGLKQRTALHVAAMQGSFYLAKQVIDIMDKNGFTGKEFLALEDGRSGLNAYEMACTIIGNTSIDVYMRAKHMLYAPSKRKYDTSYNIFGEDYFSGTYEAYEDTLWRIALQTGSCKDLLMLLRNDSRYLFQTCYGLSVLDVAIIQNDAELLQYIFNAFGIGDETIYWPDQFYYPSELSLNSLGTGRYRSWKQFIQASPPKSSIKRRMQDANLNARKFLSIKDLARKFYNLGAIEKIRREVEPPERLIVPEDEIFLRRLVSKGLLVPAVRGELEPSENGRAEFKYLMTMAKDIDRMCGQCNVDEFKADVDFNFEDRRSLRFSILRCHYALKASTANFSAPQRVELLKTISRSNYPYTWMYDGQGRGPYDIFIDHDDSQSESQEYGKFDSLDLRPVDARGRSFILKVVTKQFLGKVPDIPIVSFLRDHGNFFQPGTDNHILSLRLFELALKLGNEKILRVFFPYRIEQLSIPGEYLLYAAATGNESILQKLMRKINDPMIEDYHGNTALHYAVDSSIMSKYVDPPSGICSVDDHCMMKELWGMKNKGEFLLQENQTVTEYPSTPQQHLYAGRKACILMLQQAGVDLQQANHSGNIPDPGTSSDASFRSWWYELLVKDTTDKKNNFNQAGNALSVVGTLVASTSYIGPLQPPLSYDKNTGDVQTSNSLVKIFMWTNTLAFYMAIASVMFAVVPSLPMPQEGVVDELRRAQHMVSTSLVLLMASIACILASFAASTAAGVGTEEFHGGSNFLLSPSLIGWIFCLVAMTGFFIRVMRLVFYKNPLVRQVYKFSFTKFCQKVVTQIPRLTHYFFCIIFLAIISVVLLPLLLCRTKRSIRETIADYNRDIWIPLLLYRNKGSIRRTIERYWYLL